MKDKRSKTSAANGKQGGRPRELEDFEALPDENWRPINHNNGYFISDHGRVISVKRGSPSILRAGTLSRGYKMVSLQNGIAKANYTVHRLVLEAFVGYRPFNLQCSHLDGDPSNNHLDNLKWESTKENCDRKREHGTYLQGEQVPKAKLSEKDVLNIRKLHATGEYSQRQLARMYNLSRCPIQNIIHRRSWKHI